MRKSFKRAGFITVSIIATTSVGVAFGTWSANGSATGSSNGTGRAKAPLTVSVTAPSNMYPTQLNAGDLVVTVDNHNPYNVTLNSASVTGVTCGAGTSPVTVPLDNFTFAASAVTTGKEVAARDTTQSSSSVEGADAEAKIAIMEVKDLPEACADGAAISFAVAVLGAQSAR